MYPVELRYAQLARLDRIALEDPLAIVAGAEDGCPIVVRADGRRQQITDSGRIRPRGKAPARRPAVTVTVAELAAGSVIGSAA